MASPDPPSANCACLKWAAGAVITWALTAVDSGRNQKLIMKTIYKSEWLQTHCSPAWCNNKGNDLPCKPIKRFQWGQMSRLVIVFFIVNNRCRGATFDSEQWLDDYKWWGKPVKVHSNSAQCWSECDSCDSCNDWTWMIHESRWIWSGQHVTAGAVASLGELP